MCVCVSGLKWCEMERCVKWMVPFAMAIREVGSSSLKTFKGIPAENTHNIQSHAPYLDWLVRCLFIQHISNPEVECEGVCEGSPCRVMFCFKLLTA